MDFITLQPGHSELNWPITFGNSKMTKMHIFEVLAFLSLVASVALDDFFKQKMAFADKN
mgnify:CR=1 FL=1